MSPFTNTRCIHIVDDADDVVETGNSYEVAYTQAHQLANENNRVYRVKSVRTTERTKLHAIAIPQVRVVP